MTIHILRYQGLAVDDYGFVLDALDLGYPRLSLKLGTSDINMKWKIQGIPREKGHYR